VWAPDVSFEENVTPFSFSQPPTLRSSTQAFAVVNSERVSTCALERSSRHLQEQLLDRPDASTQALLGQRRQLPWTGV
jgi:hypothetical protein